MKIIHRPLYQFAGTIKRNWDNIDAKAKIYVEKMFSLNQVEPDKEGKSYDPARVVISGFLQNSRTWRGELARQVKRELKEIIEL